MRPSDPEVLALSQYQIVRRVFSFLSIRQVRNAASVCKLWYDVSLAEKKYRQKRAAPKVFSWRGPDRESGFYDQYPFPKSPDHLDLKEKFTQFVSSLWMDPQVAIVFSVGAPEDLLKMVPLEQTLDPDNIYLPRFHVDADLFHETLPQDCMFLLMSTDGVIVSFVDQAAETYRSSEIENVILPPTETPAVSVVLLPKNGKTKMIPFQVSEMRHQLKECLDELRDLKPHLKTTAQLNEELLYRSCGMRLSAQDRIRCIISLSNTHDYSHMLRIIKAVVLKEDGQVAIAGGVGNLIKCSEVRESIIEEIKAYQQECEGTIPTERYRSLGLILAGEGVGAWSVIIPKSVKTADQVEQILKQLQSCTINEKTSCGFMFACCARGRYLYKHQPDVESSLFHKLFPRIPLIGAFCGGEMGFNCVGNAVHVPGHSHEGSDQNDGKKRKLEADDRKKLRVLNKHLSHSFTTVFLILSF